MNSLLKIVIVVAISVLLIIALSLLKNRTKMVTVLHRKYLLQLLQLGIALYCVIHVIHIYDPTLNPKSVLLTGSALIVAIVGFAAQTAISDVICGLLISLNKPFEVGDRIIIDGMDPGIVEDITLRHIVVAIYDGLKIIVPNSQLNTKTVINFSYKNTERNGVHLQFSVSYDTDVPKAMDVIRDCVAESPYTLGVTRNAITEDSSPVYFLKFADSALILETTIFVPKGVSTYVATTDINTRVVDAFRQHGIEIPYNYLNIVESEATKTVTATSDQKKKTGPKKRHYRTSNLKLIGTDNDVIQAKELASNFAMKQKLTVKDSNQIELLTEEALSLITTMIGTVKSQLWIEGSGVEYRIHLSVDTTVGTEEYKRLIALSSSGRNEAISGVAGRIFDAMVRGIKSVDSEDTTPSYEWDMDSNDVSQDELSESILGALASGIRVAVTKDQVEFVVEKTKL